MLVTYVLFFLFKQKNKIKVQALDFTCFLQGYIHLKNQMKLSEQSFHDVTSHFLGSHPLLSSWLSNLLSGRLACDNSPRTGPRFWGCPPAGPPARFHGGGAAMGAGPGAEAWHPSPPGAPTP